MNRDKKIDKINAYRKVIDSKRLPKVDDKADVTVESEILAEFSAWAENQLSILLGDKLESTPSSPFSDEEIAVLKHVSAKVLSKVRAHESAQEPKTTPKLESPSIRKDVQARPVPKAPQAKRPENVNRLLASLNEMENEGPEF